MIQTNHEITVDICELRVQSHGTVHDPSAAEMSECITKGIGILIDKKMNARTTKFTVLCNKNHGPTVDFVVMFADMFRWVNIKFKCWRSDRDERDRKSVV